MGKPGGGSGGGGGGSATASASTALNGAPAFDGPFAAQATKTREGTVNTAAAHVEDTIQNRIGEGRGATAMRQQFAKDVNTAISQNTSAQAWVFDNMSPGTPSQIVRSSLQGSSISRYRAMNQGK